MSDTLACAFYGRVSTEDNQDPTLSLPRQLSNCERAVERVGGRIVAHFYDIESGDTSFEERGSGRKLRGFDIPIPRDGGLNDLLELAASGKFAVAVCESINRFARNPSVTFRAEDELRLAGVKLWAIDEPWEESFGSIVLRHVNVGIARGYLHELKVKSRQGLEAACKQGRHAGGIPLYGYVFRELPHPNPHRAREGKRMRILEPDPIRAAVIKTIFNHYVNRGLGIGDIIAKLNSDPERYPPPSAPRPERSRGFWAKSTVWDILHNPKYTGYQVWNRRARKRGGKHNPPEAWVWSDEPAHEPLVSREMFERGALIGISNDNRAQKREEGEAPAATFLLRSFLRCGICGLRMQGHRAKRGSHYYTCEARRRPAGLAPEDHPRTVNVNEVRAGQKILQFLNDHVFGADRISHLAELLDASDPEADREREEIKKLEKELANIDTKVRRLLINVEEEEPGSDAANVYRSRLRELASIRARKEQQLQAARREIEQRPTPQAAARLLARLPVVEVDTGKLTERDFRDLLEALSLKAIYTPATKELTVRVALAPSLFHDAASQKDGGFVPRAGFETADGSRMYRGLVRAPDGFRTRDLRLERAVS